MNTLTLDELKGRLNYNPATGAFVWLVGRPRAKPGNVAGHLNWKGYRLITINKRPYRSHRLAWLYVHGVWPADEIDHINGVKDDNRIANLREATRSENHQNRAVDPRNTSGFTGVCWAKRAQKWKAAITLEGKKTDLGLFTSPAAAHAAYLAAKAEYHPFQPVPRDLMALEVL